jgi:hypothetical protein
MTRKITITLLMALAVVGQLAPARAETCAPAPVTARGEPARYEWMAKLKARANWRAKVRATTDLGPDWAVWKQARDTEERCTAGAEGTVCIFVGTPCRL